jgi:Co/Zn/Cd efflux system component
VYGAGVPLHPLQPILSPLCCIIGVKIISKNKTGNIEKEWKILLLGGFIGSILNGISSSFIYNNGVITSSMYGYIFGDMLGQITLMVMLIYMFKFLRIFRQ